MDEPDITFHLREIAADLRIAADALRPAGSRSTSTAVAILEHDLDHHLPEAQRLLGAAPDGGPSAPGARDPNRDPDRDPERLADALTAWADELTALAAEPDRSRLLAAAASQVPVLHSRVRAVYRDLSRSPG